MVKGIKVSKRLAASRAQPRALAKFFMSLNKAISAGKEKRQPYRKSKAFDSSCRNHGSCSWCVGNRTHKNKKRMIEQKQLEQSEDDA